MKKKPPVHRFNDVLFTKCGIYSSVCTITFLDSLTTCKNCLRIMSKEKGK